MNGSRFSALLRSTLTIPVIASAALGVGSPALAITAFVSPFAPGDFILTNTPGGDGTVDFTNAASGEVTLIGSNNNIIPPAASSTTWVLVNPVTQAYRITFAWSFVGDPVYDGDTGDQAGYLVNGAANYIANEDGQEGGPETVNLLPGQTFGFIVDTADNTGSAGAFTVNNFNAAPVPFESDVLPLMGATVLFGGAMWWKRKRAEKSLNAFKADDESVNN